MNEFMYAMNHPQRCFPENLINKRKYSCFDTHVC